MSHDPGLESLYRLIQHCSRIPSEAARQQEYYDLSGLGYKDTPSPYIQVLRRIDHLIGRLKGIRQEVQQLQSHAHEWSDEDYCVHCGADERA